MLKTLITTCLGIAFATFCHAQNIDSASSPRVWLRADKKSGAGWNDTSPFKRHATAISAAALPASESLINFNPALLFDGVDDYLKIPFSLENKPELSVLAVFQSADTTERGIWAAENSPLRKIFLTTRKSIGPGTISDAYGKVENMPVLNSVLQNWENSQQGSSSVGFIGLGSAGALNPFKSFKGAISEIIVFDRTLSFSERLQFETYLAIKYGTGRTSGNMLSSNEKLLWDAEKNSTYSHNIAGLGRDDYFQLYQKQSGSVYDSGFLQMSVGDLKSTNANNQSTWQNESFIVWGDNGLLLKTSPGQGQDSILSLINRKWLVTASGFHSSAPVNVYADLKKFPAEPLGYWLVIDRTGQGDFSADNLDYIEADKIADGKIVFKDIRWDVDGSGSDNFTFARAKDLFAVVRKLHDPLCTEPTAGVVRIDVIKGKAQFAFHLESDDKKIARSWKDNAISKTQEELTVGKYTVTLVDNSKETLTRTFTMQVPNALQISLGPDQQLQDGKQIKLDVSSQIPDTVNAAVAWENSFGFHSTETQINVSESGVYVVSVTNLADDCVYTDAIAIGGAEAQRISVYPSIVQSNEQFNVGISLPVVGTVGFRIFSSRGILLQSWSGQSQSEYLFKTSVKDPGVYMIIVQTRSGVETRKIVVY